VIRFYPDKAWRQHKLWIAMHPTTMRKMTGFSSGHYQGCNRAMKMALKD
jgi:hypothetical protein